MAPQMSYKMLPKHLMISFTIAIALSSVISVPASTQESSRTLASLTPPPPPPTPPLPRNQRVPGGALGLGETAACANTNQPLMALVPIENPVLTISEHPTFLFYTPYTSEDFSFGEFSITVGPSEMARLYHTRFTLPETPGIVSISLPSSPDYALKDGEFYHWYFKLYCQGNTTASSDLDVNGWVQRVARTPEREQQINAATPEIWYDAIATLADRRRTSPQDTTLQNQWSSLLQFIDSENLSQEPLAGPVQILER